MALFESEIQELIYGVLIHDMSLVEYLGGDSTDPRIYLSLNDSRAQMITSGKPAYVVVETKPAPAPVSLSSGIDDRVERYCLHVLSRPEDRDLRAAIEGRFRELLHRKCFTTAHFIVYHVHEDGREGVLTETGLFNYEYSVSLKYLPKT